MIHLAQSAMKTKAPVVAIPIEGMAPICVDGVRLRKGLKGVVITSVEVVERWLIVRGRVGERVRTCAKFAPMDSRTARKMVGDWAEKERVKRRKVIEMGSLAPAEVKAEKLRKIEKEGLEDHNREVFAAERRVERVRERVRERVNPKRVERVMDPLTRLHYVAHHGADRRRVKASAVVGWRIKKLREEWKSLVKFNPNRRKTTARPFLKAGKAGKVIAMVKELVRLMAIWKGLQVERVQLPKDIGQEDREWISVDPLLRVRGVRVDPRWERVWDRRELAAELREARAELRGRTQVGLDDDLEVAA